MSGKDINWPPGEGDDHRWRRPPPPPPPKKKDRDEVDKLQTFIRCRKHNVSYPQGGFCPACAVGR